MKNLYKILEVDPGASAEVIKRAYRALAEKYHPDRQGSVNVSDEKMKQINNAYSVLSDPKKRKKYDREIFSSSKPFLKMKDENKWSIVAIIFDVIFVIALAKVLIKQFPPLLLLLIPSAVFYLFVRYPKTFARMYVKSSSIGKKQ